MKTLNRRELISWLGTVTALASSGSVHGKPEVRFGPNADLVLPQTPEVEHPIVPPWSLINSFPLIPDHRELRIRNRATVERYLSLAGPDRAERWQLYAKDCKNMVDGFLPSPVQQPSVPAAEVPGGRDFQKQMELMNVRNFPDWKFYNNIIFETADPNYILVEGDGGGLSYLNNREHPNRHSDHYFHVFRLVDGRIRNYSEIRNELKELREFGWVPSLPRLEPFERMYDAVAYGDEPYESSYVDDGELRLQNLQVLRAYFACSGRQCAERWRFFSEDGSYGPGYTADGRIMRANGIEKIRAAEVLRAASFPDWSYSSLIIHQTTDPQYFAADVLGKGECVDYGDKPFQFQEHFYITFRMRRGKIAALREYSNPSRIPEILGWDLKLPNTNP